MAYSFDTLGYAHHLEAAGVDRQQAAAHATAARDFIMPEIVTKSDLQLALENQFYKTVFAIGSVVVAAVGGLGIFLRLTGAH